jgi:hypothetical protein
VKHSIQTLLGLALASLVLPALAEVHASTDIGTLDSATAEKVFPAKPPYSPYAGRNFPTRPLFGDTHRIRRSRWTRALLARGSDPGRLSFAKGDEITASSGQRAKLSRPLDFLVVSDHSDGFGFFPQLMSGDPDLLATPQGRKWYDEIQSGKGAQAAVDIVTSFGRGQMPKGFPLPGHAAYRNAWQRDDQGGRGGERAWSVHGVHRLRVDLECRRQQPAQQCHLPRRRRKASLIEPYTTQPPLGSPNPRDLWKWMVMCEEKTGAQILAIAHNGNLSNGRMFPIIESFSGKRIDRAYAESRARWEPLYEATQIKGDGETHPLLSPNDEFASFERWDKGNLDLTELKKPEMLEFEYARSAFRNGLKMEAELGVNPYKFGLVGSTDSHTALSAVEEDNFFGKTSSSEPGPDRACTRSSRARRRRSWAGKPSRPATPRVGAGEHARIDLRRDEAPRNLRDHGPAHGGALLRRLRFRRGGREQPHARKVGYAKGVPMGGDLSDAPKGKAPTFLVAALKDPIGANLDRYQIVKGWLDAKGETHEKVYDVAWSGDRKAGGDGKIPAVGNTVDVANATWTNTIGAPELVAVWKDPDFNPALRAFYYGRVIEIPTPRWTAYDAKYFGVTMPKEVPMTTTERAYTSPIWYTPSKPDGKSG